MVLTKTAAIAIACLAAAGAAGQTPIQRKSIDWFGVPDSARAQLDGSVQPDTKRPDKSPTENRKAHNAPSAADKRKVIFFFAGQGTRWVTGNVVPVKYVVTILFLKEQCPLDIIGAEHMHRAWRFADGGCWAPTADDGYAFASSVTGAISDVPGPLEYFIHGEVQADSSVLITEPGFDSLTFYASANERITERVLRQIEGMRNARP